MEMTKAREGKGAHFRVIKAGCSLAYDFSISRFPRMSSACSQCFRLQLQWEREFSVLGSHLWRPRSTFV